MKAVVAAFNQEKALVGAFSVITNLRMQFGRNFLKHYVKAMFNGGTRKRMMSSSSPLGAESPPPGPPPLGYPALATPAPATTPPCKQVKLEVNINIPIRIQVRVV